VHAATFKRRLRDCASVLESRAKCVELAEAIDAGEAAASALERVGKELQSAESWGTWDLLGGGLLSTMVKHSSIDRARDEAVHAQKMLHRFSEELADADERLRVSLEGIGGFSRFADYFFDGLIADWNVQSKIGKALDACGSAQQQVDSAIAACQQRLADAEKQLEAIGEQRRRYIEQA
jgi:hypothetical protein